MRYLIDTHVALWAVSNDPHFGPHAHLTLANPDHEVFVSIASVWEIAIKAATGKLHVPDDLLHILGATDIQLLPITADHALAAGGLPLHHRDPFDRMLVAQARAEGLTLVTADAALASYDVEILPADR